MPRYGLQLDDREYGNAPERHGKHRKHHRLERRFAKLLQLMPWHGELGGKHGTGAIAYAGTRSDHDRRRYALRNVLRFLSRTACDECEGWGDGNPDTDGHYEQHGRHGAALQPDVHAGPGHSDGPGDDDSAGADAGMRLLPCHPAGDRSPQYSPVAFVLHLPRHGLQLDDCEHGYAPERRGKHRKWKHAGMEPHNALLFELVPRYGALVVRNKAVPSALL